MGNKAAPKPSKQPIPLHLRAWRKHRGYSQQQLAEIIGTTKATISRIETRKQNWDQAFLQAAADALRCSAADLFMRDPIEQPLWSVLENLSPPERQQVLEVAQIISKRTGTVG